MTEGYAIIDSHAHLEELEDLEAALQRARRRGIVAIIAVGSDYESNQQALEIAERHKGFVYPALGLHPWRLGDAILSLDRNLRFIEDNIERAVAIGEIGLDYHKDIVDRSSKEVQKGALKSLLDMARRFDKPAILHSRQAWRDGFTLARDAGITKAVFHWYAGPVKVLREILGAGYLVSATLAAEYHEEHRQAIKEAPVDSLLLETDSPVVYWRGTDSEHIAEPADVVRALEAVAGLKRMEPGVVAGKTTQNALRLFGISHPMATKGRG